MLALQTHIDFLNDHHRMEKDENTYIKRKQKIRLREMTNINRVNIELLKNPARLKVQKVEKMQVIYLTKKIKPKSILVDFDGTIGEYLDGINAQRRSQLFWPHLDEFCELSPFYNFYIYSFTNLYASNVCSRRNSKQDFRLFLYKILF